MSDTPPRDVIPPPDRHQLERLNTLWAIVDERASSGAGLRARIGGLGRRLFARVLSKQQEFNAALVDHINRNDQVGREVHRVSATLIDDLQRFQHALAARERRSDNAVALLTASHEELRASVGVLHQASQNLKREITRLAQEGVPVASARGEPGAAPSAARTGEALDSHKYVGFEDQFRGAPGEIRERVSGYVPLFEGASDVLDIGCGRGEFLALLGERGVRARGIDINAAMIDICRRHGLDATEADALAYLKAQPDGSLGGLFAAQVIEHLDPPYLTSLLDAAFDKLRPGAPLVLETINPACWFAFFESYIRDITHVRPIHPDTLKFLLIANGFQRVDIRYRAPYPEQDKLQPLPPNATLGDSVDTLNANVERLNRLLFTWLDYAAVGYRP
jgi:SAM-dependent methyltransferase